MALKLNPISGEFDLVGVSGALLLGSFVKQIYYVDASTQTLNTGAMTTLTGLSQSVVVETGEQVLVFAKLSNSGQSLSGNNQFQAYRDSTALSTLATQETQRADAGATGTYDVTTVIAYDAPAAGTYTYTIKGRRGSGSAGNGYLGPSNVIIVRIGAALV